LADGIESLIQKVRLRIADLFETGSPPCISHAGDHGLAKAFRSAHTVTALNERQDGVRAHFHGSVHIAVLPSDDYGQVAKIIGDPQSGA
jgi:hypothetical protein